MNTSSTGGQASSTNTTAAASGAGNDQLSQAFDKAIAEAQKTLATTTERGADLYALKQSVR